MGRLIIAAMRRYQQHAPSWIKGNCQAVPHCSEYGIRAVRINGALAGSMMAWRRINSCGAIASAQGVSGDPCNEPPCVTSSVDEHCGRPWPN